GADGAEHPPRHLPVVGLAQLVALRPLGRPRRLVGHGPAPGASGPAPSPPRPSPPPSPATPSTTVPCPGWFRSHTGRCERLGGGGRKGGSVPTKSPGGGGDVVAHSSVWASQGLSPAVAGRRSDRSTFHRNGSVDAPSRKAPAVEIWLRPVNPSSSR